MTDTTPATCALGRASYGAEDTPETSCYIGLTEDEAGNPVVIFAPGAEQDPTGKLPALATGLLQQHPALAQRHPDMITWYLTYWLRDIERAAKAGVSVETWLGRVGVSRQTARALLQLRFRSVSAEGGSAEYSVFEPAFSEPAHSCEAVLRGLEAAYARVAGPVHRR